MAWPTSPGPNGVKITSWTPTRVSTAQSGKQQVRSVGAQRFRIELAYQNLPRSNSEPFEAALAALRGQYNTTTLVVPGATDSPQGSWSGTPLVDGAAQTGRTINLKGFGFGLTGVVKAGDYFTWAGDLKVYKATSDANSDGFGKAAISIEPAIMTSPADGAAIASSNVAFTVALMADSVDVQLTPPSFRAISASFIERV